MAERRPPIPRELVRAVKVEAGHRCAIPTCRATSGLQVHHIEPWSKVGRHEFHNLIYICANCHARATAGEIDRKAMKRYKTDLSVSVAVGHSPGVDGSGPPMPDWWIRPRTLPARTSTFVNRVRELGVVLQSMREVAEQPRVVLLRGGQGTGKSSLAEHWAHQHKELFPDGQLFVKFDSPSSPTELVTVAEAMRYALQSMGCPPRRIPHGLAARTALFRSVTADRSLLVVLDQVTSAAQVRPFVPESGRAGVIVTSTGTLGDLSGIEAARLPLAPLGREQSARMLFTLCGHEPLTPDAARSAEEIVASCAGLPLAINLCARQVARPLGSFESVAQSVAEEETRLERIGVGDSSLQAVFDMSYQRLSLPARRGYRLLGLAPASPVTVSAAAALMGAPTAGALAILEELHEAHLVEAAVEENPRHIAVRMHELLRLHARTSSVRLGDPGEAEELLDRLLAYAACVTEAIDRAISSERLRISSVASQAARAEQSLVLGWDARWGMRPGYPAGLAAHLAFEREQAFLFEIVAAADLAGVSTDRDWLICRVADAMWPATMGHGHDLKLAGLYAVASSAADRRGDRGTCSRLEMLYARGLLAQGSFREASDTAERAIGYAQDLGNRWLEASAREVKAIIVYHEDGADRALELFELASSTFPRKQRRGIAIQLYFIGRCHLDRREPGARQAVVALRRALAHFLALDDLVFQARAGSFLAEALLADGKPDEADVVARRVVDVAQGAGEDAAQVRALMVLADLSTLGERASWLARARHVAQTVSDPALIEWRNARRTAEFR